jgi:molecular chaperone DnaJ
MATTSRDYYEVLGVPRDADDKTIKDAFRTLALQYHPDRNKAPDAEERFKEIAAAYAVLSDPKKRAAYDIGGVAGMAGVSTEDLFSGINFEDLFGGPGFDFGGGGLFERFFHRRRPSGPPRGANLEVDLEVPLERVLTGGEETVHLTHPQTCAACQGSGAKPGTAPRRCETCNGTGQRVTSRRDSGITFQQITTCPGCHGRGSIIDQPCPECHGQGEVERAETLTVTVPAGVEERMALRIPGRGLPSRDAGGTPGDLFVIVHSAPDTRFARRGADLWRAATVPVVDAVLGTELEVPTLDGSTTVTIPPGTQPDTVLRLHGKGLPEFGGDRRGDLYLRVHVHVPDRLSSKERDLYERLRTLSG